MKPDVMLELLEGAADQLAIRVSYETMQSTLVGTSAARGGLCRLKTPEGMQWRVIIDKRATTEERITTLANALATFDTSELALPAKVRELLRLHEGSGRIRRRAA